MFIKVRAALVQMWQRFIPVEKINGANIYLNGSNNLYPYEIEAVISNSPTASRCASVMAKYISGEGVLSEDGETILKYKDLPVVNKKKNYKIPDIIEMSARSIAKQNGVWFHIGWGINKEGELHQSSIDVLDYVKPRKAKEDSEDNLGKIYLKKWDDKGFKGNAGSDEWYYPYNTDQNVIFAQIKADNVGRESDEMAEQIKNYRGQVLYLNLTPEYEYAISPLNAVYNDADTESRISIYANTNARDGFLGKTTVITQGLDEEQERSIKEDLKYFLGPENSSSMYHLNVEQAENLDDVIKYIQLKPNFDDKLFDVTDKRVLRNIFGAFNNIPPALVLSGEGSLFGTSADTYSEMKDFYSEQTREEREKLERALSYAGFPVKIKPIGNNINDVQKVDKTLEAQAALRGSVGGVTALIQLQESVSRGFTQRTSAIEIVKNIYGIDEEQAKIMIGDPINIEKQTLEGNATE